MAGIGRRLTLTPAYYYAQRGLFARVEMVLLFEMIDQLFPVRAKFFLTGAAVLQLVIKVVSIICGWGEKLSALNRAIEFLF